MIFACFYRKASHNVYIIIFLLFPVKLNTSERDAKCPPLSVATICPLILRILRQGRSSLLLKDVPPYFSRTFLLTCQVRSSLLLKDVLLTSQGCSSLLLKDVPPYFSRMFLLTSQERSSLLLKYLQLSLLSLIL
jgi:hypothetical protein